MDKLKMQSADITEQNIEKIAVLFPSVVTEVKDETGTLRKAIDFDKLKLLLSEGRDAVALVDSDSERYDFTWVGKRQAIVDAATPIRKTLRPCVEESKNWDITENLYIEGDNLEVLKLLQESYLGKVKVIYIDPPYNTGNDFIYRDDFSQTKDEYEDELGLFDEEGNRLFRNTETNGRFHSDWCSMIYPRLQLARNLLTDDGVIFISIDDNEIENLMKLCNEVFGESNKIGLITIQSNPRGSQSSKHLSSVHEYILMYSRDASSLELKGVSKSDESEGEYSEIDENGRKYRLLGLRQRGGAWRKEQRPLLHYPIYVNQQNNKVSLTKSDEYNVEVIPQRPSGELSRWAWGREKFEKENYMLMGKKVTRSGQDDAWDIFRKDYFDNDDGSEKTAKIKTIWIEKEINYQNAKNEINELFGNSDLFDFPKPTYIVQRLASMLYSDDDDIILDFFAGSGTTAHAVMKLNAEDGNNRKFILCQLDEPCNEKSEAFKASYKTICGIGKERIRRAGAKIEEEQANKTDLFTEGKKKLDTGFRVFKLDSTNMKDVYYSAGEYQQKDLLDLISNIKDDRTDLDLLYGCLIDWGVPLSLPHKQEKINGQTVHFVNETDLIACFDENVSEETIRTIAKRKPIRVVFRDASFKDSADKINVTEIFKAISPETTVKVI
ncbi:DNA methylase N-4 [Bacteroidia bacterium]|nr:DNA methylase N-4 [Bacteroidia bacterium]